MRAIVSAPSRAPQRALSPPYAHERTCDAAARPTTSRSAGASMRAMQFPSTAILADSWHHDGPGWWIVFVILFWILVIGSIVFLLRSRGGWGPPRVQVERESALDVLDARYARGEIDADEYRERRSVLAGQEPRT
jgi:putative membrane protein